MDKIEKYSLVDEAYKRIREYLLKSNFIEGQKIPSENQLSKDLCVSRVVIRDALSQLRNERVIVTYQGKGSFLANPINFNSGLLNMEEKIDFDLFVKIMEFRETIEFSAIDYAMQYATNEELASLQNIVDEMEKIISDINNFTIKDYEFHSRIVKCSHNPFLISAHESCKEMILIALKSMNLLAGSDCYAIDLHKKIAMRLIAKDAKGAISLYKNNGEYNLARMKEVFNTTK